MTGLVVFAGILIGAWLQQTLASARLARVMQAGSA
jgi:hypothetical protein